MSVGALSALSAARMRSALVLATTATATCAGVVAFADELVFGFGGNGGGGGGRAVHSNGAPARLHGQNSMREFARDGGDADVEEYTEATRGGGLGPRGRAWQPWRSLGRSAGTTRHATESKRAVAVTHASELAAPSRVGAVRGGDDRSFGGWSSAGTAREGTQLTDEQLERNLRFAQRLEGRWKQKSVSNMRAYLRAIGANEIAAAVISAMPLTGTEVVTPFDDGSVEVRSWGIGRSWVRRLPNGTPESPSEVASTRNAQGEDVWARAHFDPDGTHVVALGGGKRGGRFESRRSVRAGARADGAEDEMTVVTTYVGDGVRESMTWAFKRA